MSDDEDTIIYDEIEYNNNELINNEDSNYFYENYDIKKNKSPNILSKYEKTKVIFERMQLIEGGSDVFIDNPEKYNNIYDIVLEELRLKKIPFIIKRNIGNSFEYWKLEDLIII
jgi:DNA-directed RNA polymerase subunit K/omega